MPSRCSSTRRRRPSRILQAGRRSGSGRRTPAVLRSSSSSVGLRAHLGQQFGEVLLALGGELVDPLAPSRPRRGTRNQLPGCLLGDPAGLGQLAQRRVQGAVGELPERAEQRCEPLAQLVAVQGALTEQPQYSYLQHGLRPFPVGGCRYDVSGRYMRHSPHAVTTCAWPVRTERGDQVRYRRVGTVTSATNGAARSRDILPRRAGKIHHRVRRSEFRVTRRRTSEVHRRASGGQLVLATAQTGQEAPAWRP